MENHPHSLWISWAPRHEDFGMMVQQIRGYLELLRDINPALQQWHILLDDWIPAGDDLTCLFKQLSEYGRPKKQYRQQYQHLDNNFEIVANTTSDIGFSVTFYTLGKDFDGKVDWELADTIKLRFSTGQFGPNIVLDFPGQRGEDIVRCSVLKEIMTKSISYWQADDAQVLTTAMLDLFPQRYLSRSILHATWMCFSRHALLAQCIKPDIPCQIERIGDDGLFFTLAPHSPNPAHAEDRALATAVQAKFDEFHFNHPFVFYGWPYDPDEAHYAVHITGAAEGMAYAVGFAAFDGYDAERRVLLCARLFKYPPGWEPDLHPIYATDAERLESLPYVVLARHQIAAVHYVGADTPIEWHIGISRHADTLRVLINDWAGIPEQQLRIIYTPPSTPSCTS